MKITKEVRVGFLALIAGVLLYWGVNFLKGSDLLKDTKRYYAVYSTVNDLTVSNMVTYDGVQVGRVSDISINQGNNNVLVEMEIDGYIVIGDSTVAKLSSDLLGTKRIRLEIRNIDSPLQPGDTLIAMNEPSLPEMLGETGNSLEATIIKINAILDNFEGSAGMIKDNLEALKVTQGEIQKTLKYSRYQLGVVGDNTNEFIDGLQETNLKLQPVVDKFGQTADTLKAIKINETLENLNVTLLKFQETMDAVQSNQGTIGKLMTNDSLYNNLNSAVESLDSLLIHMNSYPKHFFGPLGKSHKKVKKDLAKEKK